MSTERNDRKTALDAERENMRRRTEECNEISRLYVDSQTQLAQRGEEVAAWKARVVEKEAQANEISGNYQQLSASHDRLTQQLSQLQALVRALSKDFHLEDMRKAEAEAQKWEAEGDMYGWNFHQGRASGIREEQFIVYRIMRENGIDPLKALDATTPAPMGSNILEEDIGKAMMRSKGGDGE